MFLENFQNILAKNRLYNRNELYMQENFLLGRIVLKR